MNHTPPKIINRYMRRLFNIALIGINIPVAFAAEPANYYNDVNANSPAQLRSSLHGAIDDHTRFPYSSSSTDTWDILESADQDTTDASRVTTVYSNKSYSKQGGGNNNYNREHSWPKSYGFPDDNSSNYPFTDAHHLFISESRYNSLRGNEYFDDCNASCAENNTTTNDGRGGQGGGYPGDSNWSDSNSWEVWVERRGDIARAMFYMDLRYEGGNHGITGASEPDLRLTNDINLISQSSTGNNLSVAYMGLLSTLLQWHLQDPVDVDEMNRNDTVFSFQGNRNPFVDHPEWVACIYQNQCSGGNGGGSNSSDSLLNNGDTISGIAASTGQFRYYRLQVPAGASNLEISINGGSGDADLYTQVGAQPTTSSYSCRPYLTGNTETCSVASPVTGEYIIGIRAYEAISGVTLRVSYSVSNAGSNNDAPVGEEHTNISGDLQRWRNFTITIPAGKSRFEARLSGGTGDADLYVRADAAPTLSTYDCRPYLTGNNETCTLNNPTAGTWTISIYGYSAYSGATLEYYYYD